VNLSAPFIKRPVMTTLIMVAILLFGLYAYELLPVSDIPNIDYPTITVTASQPGGSPEYMANLVATPLERNFAKISGVSLMSSSNSLGQTQIVLNFDFNADLSSKEVEVAQAINASLPDLPPMPTNPTYQKFNPSDSPILFLVLTTNTQTLGTLYEVGYNILAQPLSMINGVSQVIVYGDPYAVRIQADPMKLMAHAIDFNTLTAALVGANPNFPSGLLKGSFQDNVLNTLGMISTAEGYEDVIIREVQGFPLYVGDVARGIDAVEQRTPFFKYVTKDQALNTVVLAVSRLPGSNTIAISREIFDLLPNLKKAIPGSIDLDVFYDKSDPIIESVNEVQITLLIALFLVVAVIFIYLGKLIDTIIPSLVLPLSLIATMIVMYLVGFNLDNLSLLALILSIGFVVDDSIVVLENIVRHTEMEKKIYDAAVDGSKEISTTVLTMSLALSAVFIPFVWMPGTLGKIFHEFALTIIIAIYCSGFISLTLNPMLCSRFLYGNSKKNGRNFSHQWNQKLVGWYEQALLHSLRYPLLMILVGGVCFAFSLVLLKHLRTDFIPQGNLSLVQGLHLCQQGSSSKNTIRHMQQVNEIMRQSPYVESFCTLAGYPAGNDQGAFFMRLAKPENRPVASTVASELGAQVAQVPGINTYFKPFPLIDLQIGRTTSLGQYQYTLTSNDAKTLYAAVQKFALKMEEIPEIIGINSDMRTQSPQLNITIDRDRAGLYGITAEEIESTLQFAFSGGRISTFSKGINLYDLIVEAAPEYDLLVEDLDLLYILSPITQQLVPLTSLATWKQVLAPATINHINTFPSVTISFNLAPQVALGTALQKINALAKEILPDEVNGKIQGTGQVFLETFQSLKWLIVIAIIVIYLLLGILYESFIHPITVLSALPVAALGGLATLWIFNMPLSLYSIVGLIVLIGLVQKNGIMMIDFALEYLQKPGETPRQAIIEACKVRFRPIIMTTLAAMVGTIPLVIGFGINSESNRPLGMVILGGLFVSQLITLFVTPATFLYMEKFHNWLHRRINFQKISSH
jgi:hydrophobic/amphiphilic exporter-1 (mainly G- bacteria), HAE1 family